jgi:hypothetical protein
MADIPINHWAIPWNIWKAIEKAKDLEKRGRKTKKQTQQKLQYEAVIGLCEFTTAGTLHAVAPLIAMNNQVRD